MLNNLLLRLWSTEIRTGPIIVGLGIFALLSALRRWRRLHYVPSYFVFYPAAALDRDISQLYGTGPLQSVSRREERHRLKRAILAKATFSVVMSFVVIPAAVGSAAAFFMNRNELLVLIGIVLIWQAYSAFQSTLDNAVHALHPKASALFFVSLYVSYLFFVAGCMWQAYRFIAPFATAGNYGGLAASVWDGLFQFAGFVILAGIVGNIVAYLITDQEIARPSWSVNAHSGVDDETSRDA